MFALLAISKELGFDGLELHGAHGYFLDQFFWEKTNKRTDKYGGTIGERARFVAEVVKVVRKEVGNDFSAYTQDFAMETECV